jgi:GntR family transcriptional regulator
MPFQTKKVPLYYQLESILREKINSGKLVEGERLPTETELSQEYGVSRITVRQALASLAEEGLIERRQGLGTFVAQKKSFQGSIRLTGFIEDLMAMGIETTVKVLEVDVIPATAGEAAQLEIEPGSPVLRVKRVRYYENTPYSYVVIYLPERIGKNLAREDFAKGSLLKLLENKCRIRLGEAFQVINASLADGYVAGLLATNVGAPLLSIERTVYSKDGQPVQYVKTLYRSDMYNYTVRLMRGRKKLGNGWFHR